MDSLSTEQVDWVSRQVEDSIRVHEAVRALTPLLTQIGQQMAETFQNGGRVYFFGNGGSAADAQHWAAELSGRFYLDRPGLPAFALTVNTSEITAIGNDFGYDLTFARPLAAMAKPGDMAVAYRNAPAVPSGFGSRTQRIRMRQGRPSAKNCSTKWPKCPVLRTTSSIPSRCKWCNRYSRNGVSRIEARTLGRSETTDLRRVPSPPQRITTAGGIS